MIEMNYRETGKGPVLIILHGLFGSSDNWITISRKLEDHFRIFLPDFRNHGQSPHTESHTYEDMTKDLELFFQTNHISNASLLGHSMGGKVAMMFAAKFPDKINNLIVADIAPKSYTLEDDKDEDIEMLLDLMEKLDLSSCFSRREIDEVLSKKIESVSLRQFLLKNIYRTREGVFTWKINVPVLKTYLTAIVRDVNQDFFKSFKPVTSYPVTFIRGLKSNYISDQDIPLIKEIYPGARIIGIPNAGHWLHAEQPEAFIDALLCGIGH